MYKLFNFAKENTLYGFTLKEWNNRRIGAAKRALKREKEKAGLFPELMKFNSVEERMSQVDNMILERIKQFRNDKALDLWKCRTKFRNLPQDIKKDVLEFWNNSIAPKEPFRLLSLIHRWEEDNLYFERIKGNASKFTMSVIGIDRVLRVVEVSQDEYYAHMGAIDNNKK